MSEIEPGLVAATSDIVTPAQYYDGAHRDDAETQAIKRLLLAVLTDAVRCFQAYCRAQSCYGRRMFYDVKEWIWDRNSEGPFTFEEICETLEIDPERLRRALREWRVYSSSEVSSSRVCLPRRANVRRLGSIALPQISQVRIHSAGTDHTMP
jgi:hypothetical protein